MIKDLYRRLRDESHLPRLVFYIGLTIELLMVIADKSSYTNPIEGHLFRLTFLLFAAKLLFTKYELREWALIVLLEGIAFVSYRVTGENELIRMVTFVAACRGIPLREALKYTFYVTLAGCLCIVLLSVTGIYGETSLTQAYGHETAEETVYIGKEPVQETRYTLGMGHPNALSCMAFMLTALGVYVWFDKIKWYGYLFLLFLNTGLYLLTRSKTAMLVTAAFLLGAFLMRLVRPFREKAFLYVCGFLVFALCIAFSVDAAVCAQRVSDARWNEFFYHDPMDNGHIVALGKIDRYLSGRIITLADSYQNEGMIQTWSAFSCKNSMNYYFDMGWVKVFYRYGVIPGALYIAANLVLLWRLWKRRDGCGLALFVMFAVYTVVEAHLISVYLGRNYLLLMLGCTVAVSQTRQSATKE
ncbi:MAG: hypothetical protein NC302_03635 [Bacteroidales bacterium]|nr:hypothetical protein [Bacteroidales bacterium]MCM1414569.1 hypothetical protein [bacterium]MCM1422619.1 hypothetical protein [bacterium]